MTFGARTKLSIGLISAVVVVAVLVFPWKKFLKPTPTNLVLISIDTLRSDRLGAYGYGRDTSPNIDALARESTVFERAVTPAPWTLPAHVSMFSGTYPHGHGVVQAKNNKISPSTTLLTEYLKARGYFTVGITGGAYVSHSYGFDRGFDVYLEPDKRKRATNIIGASVEQARNELEKVKPGQPFFLFFHNYDVHCPYFPPKSYQGMFNSDGALPAEDGCGAALVNPADKGRALFISDRYDESIRSVDDGIQGLLAYLRSRRDYEQTVIILTSDHGEEFLEHGRIGHKESLHRELLFVPLIVHVPHSPPQRVEEHVSLIDILPTALDLLGLEYSREIDGVSLAEVVTRSQDPSKIRPFELSELDRGVTLRSRIGEKSHLIFNPISGESLFYDLSKDPQEQNSLVEEEPEWFDRKHQELIAFMSRVTPAKSAPNKEAAEQLEKLKSLGYLE
jgi:arylsulfatase A-like enzyme